MLGDLLNRLVAWSAALVAPDWSSLVALIPLLLLLAAAAFLLITGAKWAGAGPARNGPGRRAPRTPDGRSVRADSAAPMAVACGAFVLAFGVVAGGPWPAVGITTTLAGLGWWVTGPRRRAAVPGVRPDGLGGSDGPGGQRWPGGGRPSAGAERRPIDGADLPRPGGTPSPRRP